jgi:hypothetical protein
MMTRLHRTLSRFARRLRPAAANFAAAGAWREPGMLLHQRAAKRGR